MTQHKSTSPTKLVIPEHLMPVSQVVQLVHIFPEPLFCMMTCRTAKRHQVTSGLTLVLGNFGNVPVIAQASEAMREGSLVPRPFFCCCCKDRHNISIENYGGLGPPSFNLLLILVSCGVRLDQQTNADQLGLPCSWVIVHLSGEDWNCHVQDGKCQKKLIQKTPHMLTITRVTVEYSEITFRFNNSSQYSYTNYDFKAVHSVYTWLTL